VRLDFESAPVAVNGTEMTVEMFPLCHTSCGFSSAFLIEKGGNYRKIFSGFFDFFFHVGVVLYIGVCDSALFSSHLNISI